MLSCLHSDQNIKSFCSVSFKVPLTKSYQINQGYFKVFQSLPRKWQSISEGSTSRNISLSFFLSFFLLLSSFLAFFLSFFLSFCLSVCLFVCLSVLFGLWKCGHPAIHFSLNKLFLSHSNENVRGGVMKAFLIVSSSIE